MKKRGILLSIFLIGILIGAFIGIYNVQSSSKQEFTHIILEKAHLHIWSYDSLDSFIYEGKPLIQFRGYSSIVIYEDCEITLENNIKILVSDVIRINGQLIPADVKNVFIEIDGTVKENAFIGIY